MSAPLRAALAAVVLFAALLAATGAPAAQADDGERQAARRHFDAGLVLMRAENFAGAMVEFEASLEAFPTRNALFNLANCHKALGRYREALDAFERLRTGFEGTLPREMREAVARHEEEIRALTATLAVRASPEGATLLVDGVAAGTLPLARPLVLGPGSYALEVRLEGHDPARRTVTLVSRAAASEEFRLVPSSATLTVDVDVPGARVLVDGALAGTAPLAAPLGLAPGRHVVAVEAPGFLPGEQELELGPGERVAATFRLKPVPPEPGPEPGPAREERRAPSALFWTGLGLTLAAGAVAGGTWIGADRAHDRFTAADDRIAGGEAEAGTPAAEVLIADRDDAADDTALFSRLALGFGIAAGALAAGTAVVLGLDLRGDGNEKVSIAAAPGGVALTF
jgi:hypothetical protein